MELISLKEAAKRLGYSEKCLREIVARSRSAAKGYATHGPVIKFMQAGRGADIKFRPEWLDEFVERCTVNPVGVPTTAAPRRKTRKTAGVVRRTEKERQEWWSSL